MNKHLKVLLLVAGFTFIKSSFAQDIDLPMKDGKIFYEKVDSTSSLIKDQLYTRLRLWLANAFVSAQNVIQMDDKESGVIVGKGYFNIHSTGLSTATWPCNFTISLIAKDGKYRVQLYNFSYGEANNSMESVYNAYKKGKMKKSTGNMLKEMNDNAMAILKTISEKVSSTQSDF